MTADLWGRVCDELRFAIGQDAFTNWIDPLEYRGCEDGVARLAAPNPFIGNWVSQHYGERIQKIISKTGTEVVRLDFSVCANKPVKSGEPRQEFAEPKATFTPAPPATKPNPGPEADLPASPLDPKYKFDTFVVGKPNELAHAAARRVAEPGPATFNPLFLYGGVGLG
ncbi:MAG: DnaA N-terminal domain-containing protein, partial [Pseudomonadota bacterium]